MLQEQQTNSSVQGRLLEAAAHLFVGNSYNKVTTRMLAEQAGTSTSSIAYYFGDKQKLYEAMINEKFKLISLALDDSFHPETGLNVKLLLRKYLEIHKSQPDFPAFFIQVLTYKKGPGYQLITSALDKKRSKMERHLKASQLKQTMSKNVDVDVLRILIMSLSIFPFLLRPVFHQGGTSFDPNFFAGIIDASGDILEIYARNNFNEIK